MEEKSFRTNRSLFCFPSNFFLSLFPLLPTLNSKCWQSQTTKKNRKRIQLLAQSSSHSWLPIKSRTQAVPICSVIRFTLSSSSSSSGGTLEEHSRFHDASPGRTIRCLPQCRVKSKVEWFEIAVDCSKPNHLNQLLTFIASWSTNVNNLLCTLYQFV